MGNFIRHTAVFDGVYLWFEDSSAQPASTSSPRFDNPTFENNNCRFFSFPKLYRHPWYFRPGYRHRGRGSRSRARTAVRTRTLIFDYRPVNPRIRSSRRRWEYSETDRVGPKRARGPATPARSSWSLCARTYRGMADDKNARFESSAVTEHDEYPSIFKLLDRFQIFGTEREKNGRKQRVSLFFQWSFLLFHFECFNTC